jgi:hypothetical protein
MKVCGSDVWPCWGMMVGEDECVWLAGSRHFSNHIPRSRRVVGGQNYLARMIFWISQGCLELNMVICSGFSH